MSLSLILIRITFLLPSLTLNQKQFWKLIQSNFLNMHRTCVFSCVPTRQSCEDSCRESFHIDILSHDSAPGPDAPAQRASHGKEIKRAGFIQNSPHENFIPDLS